MTTSALAAPTVTPLRGLAWALCSFGALVASLFATIGLFGFIHWFFYWPVFDSHLVDMALWSPVWGTLSLAGVLVAGRIAFGAWLHVSASVITVVLTGLVISSGVHVVLQLWARERFSYYDPEMVGWTAGLFAVLVGLAVAAFGVLVAPRGAAVWPLIASLAAAALALFILAGNLPGLADGMEPGSWPLAIWLALSGAYALAVAILALRAGRG